MRDSKWFKRFNFDRQAWEVCHSSNPESYVSSFLEESEAQAEVDELNGAAAQSF